MSDSAVTLRMMEEMKEEMKTSFQELASSMAGSSGVLPIFPGCLFSLVIAFCIICVDFAQGSVRGIVRMRFTLCNGRLSVLAVPAEARGGLSMNM